jgi:hypothetical protein
VPGARNRLIARLWDTAPLKARYQARRETVTARPEAERLAKRLFAELREPPPVIARLRDDNSLSAALHRAALQEVTRSAGNPHHEGLKTAP